MKTSEVGTSGKDKHRYAVLSDIHGNIEALEAVIRDASEQQCDRFICLGDVVGYNTNPRECIEIVRRFKMPCVMGNHDEMVSSAAPLSGMNERATRSMEWTRNVLADDDKDWLASLKLRRVVDGFTLVHASLDSPERWNYVFDPLAAGASMNYQTTQLCFYGHTHSPMVFVRGRTIRRARYTKFRTEAGLRYMVNVGSVGEPRDGDPRAAYAVYDSALQTVALRRVEFDLAATEAKAMEAGLPLRRDRRLVSSGD
jgi:diadenosine tetraphosphatase ApaH/serine/threonine PP2A family protein phosphatase